MPPYSPSPLLTPQPSTPPTPHRPHPSSSSHDGQATQSTSSFGTGLFSGQTPTQPPNIGWGSFGHSHQSQAQSATPASQHVSWGAVPSLLPASVQWGSNTSVGGSAHASSSASSHHDVFGGSSAPTSHFQSPHQQHQHQHHHHHAFSPVQPMPDKTRKSEVKRKRFEDDEDEEMGGVGSSRTSPPADQHHQVTSPGSASEARVISAGRNLVPKRLRAGLGGVNAFDDPSSPFGSPTKQPSTTPSKSGADADQSQVPGNVDLGKMLASLDKPHLLALVTSLLSMHPHLTPTVHSLLPLPSLDSVNQSLDSYEAAIKQSLPFGLHSIRPEYAWNRVRGPLAELVSGVQGWMDFFNAKEQQQDGQGADRESVHPSTMFTLLHSITARAIKIQKDLLPPIPVRSLALHRGSALSSNRSGDTSPSAQVMIKALPSGVLSPASPNVLLTTLIPLLLSAWDSLLARISHDLNFKGKMFGREVVVGWLRGIEALGSGEVQRRESSERSKSSASGGQEGETKSGHSAGSVSRQREEEEEEERSEKERVEVLKAVQAGMRAVDASFKREIGWLVGVF